MLSEKFLDWVETELFSGEHHPGRKSSDAPATVLDQQAPLPAKSKMPDGRTSYTGVHSERITAGPPIALGEQHAVSSSSNAAPAAATTPLTFDEEVVAQRRIRIDQQSAGSNVTAGKTGGEIQAPPVDAEMNRCVNCHAEGKESWATYPCTVCKQHPLCKSCDDREGVQLRCCYYCG